MDFELTDEQKQIKALVKDFCEREVDIKRLEEIGNKSAAARTVQELRAIQPWDLIEKLHKVGLRQLSVPKKYGGTAPESDGNVTRAIAAEEAGYSGGPIAFPLGATWFILQAFTTNRYVTEEQREWLFSRFMENPRMMLAGTVSEPEGATDLHMPYDEPGAVMKTVAHKDGNEWVINGEKMFSSGGGIADFLQVATRTDKQGPLSQSMTFFWVPKDSPGMTMTPNKMLAAEFGGNVQTSYDNVRVPESQMIGQVNKGFSMIDSIFSTKWLGICGFLGTMQKMYEDMRDYAKQRIGGGKPLIQHTSTAAKLGEAAINIEAVRALLYKTAWECDQAEKAGKRASHFWDLSWYWLMKSMGWRFCELATDLYGGISGSVDMPLAGFLRHMFYFRAAGLTLDVELIKASKEYDTRFELQ